MLLKGSICWWNPQYRSCLCKQLLSSFIHFIRDAGTIIDEYNISFDYMHDFFGITGGACASLIRALVSTGKEFHVDQAVLFPCPTKAETVSHPVNAWKKGSARDFLGPTDSCIFFGLPKISETFAIPKCQPDFMFR